MSKPPKDELPAIDPAALAQVTGGTSETSALLGQLTGLLDDLKQVRSVGAQNGINPQEMMLFMMLMQQRNAQATTVVQAAPVWWVGTKRR
jgi:hypothetical protein